MCKKRKVYADKRKGKHTYKSKKAHPWELKNKKKNTGEKAQEKAMACDGLHKWEVEQIREKVDKPDHMQ